MANAPLRGMTVNERLSATGNLGYFTIAARERNRQQMIEILCRTELTEEEAAETADALLANPAFYGY